MRHDVRYCPKFPEVTPPSTFDPAISGYGPGKKWETCPCLIHTCFDAAEQGIETPEESPVYKDFL